MLFRSPPLTLRHARGLPTNNFRTNFPRKEKWRDLNDYTFDLNETEKCYDLLLKAEKIRPLQPRNPLQPGDENKSNFCRYHQWVHHSTNRCRDVMEIIQKMLDKNEIKYEAEVPKKQAGAYPVSITNINSSFAVTSDEEVDVYEHNHATAEAESHAKHGANLESPQASLIGRTSCSQDPVQADLRIPSKADTRQEIQAEIP